MSHVESLSFARPDTIGQSITVMRHVNGVYTQRYNRCRNIDGQLFRGRYKSILVEKDSHLLELLRYIHRNPLRAKLCKSIQGYPWSSHHGYISTAKKWDWLYKELLLGMFADKKGKGEKEVPGICPEGRFPGGFRLFQQEESCPLFGTRDFIDWVKEKFYRIKRHNEIPQSRQLAPSIAEIKRYADATE